MSSTTSSTGTSLLLQTRDSSGSLHDLKHPFQQIPRPFSRDPLMSGRVLWVQNFRSTSMSMMNDGAGQAFRDTDVTFFGNPVARLDTAGIASSAVNPGLSPDPTSGIVFKERIQNDQQSGGVFGLDFWFAGGSANLTVGNIFSCHLYNRDGTTWHGGNLWFDFTIGGFPAKTRVLYSQAGPTYVPLTPDSNFSANGHTCDPSITNPLDRALEWNNAKLVVDFTNNVYVSARMNNIDFTSQIKGKTLPSTPDTSPTSAHGGVWFASQNTTRRYLHVAYFIFTDES